MNVGFSNYRWKPTNKRKGDSYHYLRDVAWLDSPWRSSQEQSLATVLYVSNQFDQHWGKWIVKIHPVSPALNALRKSDIPVFSSKNDAMAWVAAVVALSN